MILGGSACLLGLGYLLLLAALLLGHPGGGTWQERDAGGSGALMAVMNGTLPSESAYCWAAGLYFQLPDC